MSKRQYPRIDSAYKNKAWAAMPENKGPRCDACGGKALFRVDVEVNWFRGDDESRKACTEHKGDALALLNRAVTPNNATDFGPDSKPKAK